MDFQYQRVSVKYTGKSVLSDSEFRERATCEGLKKLIRVLSFRFDDLV
jgi:hypothetical protein